MSGAWKNVYDILSSTSNLANPTGSKKKWVYSRRPDVKSVGFEYPYVVVYPSGYTHRSPIRTVNGRLQDIAFFVEVEVVTSDRGYANKDGQGGTQNDTIANSVVELLNSATIRAELRRLGLSLATIEPGQADAEADRETMVYSRSIFVGFNGLKAVY